jgi:hypothetical protein
MALFRITDLIPMAMTMAPMAVSVVVEQEKSDDI